MNGLRGPFCRHPTCSASSINSNTGHLLRPGMPPTPITWWVTWPWTGCSKLAPKSTLAEWSDDIINTTTAWCLLNKPSKLESIKQKQVTPSSSTPDRCGVTRKWLKLYLVEVDVTISVWQTYLVSPVSQPVVFQRIGIVFWMNKNYFTTQGNKYKKISEKHPLSSQNAKTAFLCFAAELSSTNRWGFIKTLLPQNKHRMSVDNVIPTTLKI